MENMELGKRVVAEHMAQGKETGTKENKLGFGKMSVAERPESDMNPVKLEHRVSATKGMEIML
jgi:hypothetical protein